MLPVRPTVVYLLRVSAVELKGTPQLVLLAAHVGSIHGVRVHCERLNQICGSLRIVCDGFDLRSALSDMHININYKQYSNSNLNLRSRSD